MFVVCCVLFTVVYYCVDSLFRIVPSCLSCRLLFVWVSLVVVCWLSFMLFESCRCCLMSVVVCVLFVVRARCCLSVLRSLLVLCLGVRCVTCVDVVVVGCCLLCV